MRSLMRQQLRSFRIGFRPVSDPPTNAASYTPSELCCRRALVQQQPRSFRTSFRLAPKPPTIAAIHIGSPAFTPSA